MKLSLEPEKPVESVLTDRRRISVCHIVAADLWAGAEAQIAMLLAKLSEEPDLSLCAIALGDGRLVDELRAANIEVKVIAQPHKRFVACYREARRFLQGRGVEIIHSHKTKENILAFLLAKRAGIRHMVRTQHGLPEPKTLKDRTVYRLEHITASTTSRIISVSSDLSKRMSGYVSCGKIEVVRNAVNLQQVKSLLSREAAKRKLHLPEHALVIGTAARLEPVKRIDIFLDVAQRIAQHLPNSFFVIAGAGSERGRMEQLLVGTVVERQVQFLGDRDDVYDVLRAMDLLLITSDHEGLPTVLLEAMALGTPVVSRRVGGIPEVIDDQVNGVLVDSNDAARIAEACVSVLTESSFSLRLAQS